MRLNIIISLLSVGITVIVSVGWRVFSIFPLCFPEVSGGAVDRALSLARPVGGADAAGIQTNSTN